MKNLCRHGLLALLFIAPPVMAEEGKPLWEAGLGVAAVSFPDYRGAEHRTNYVLPVPYFVYRGDFLQVDRERIRGMLLKSDSAEIDVSVNGSVPVKSSDNPAREGMPNIPAMLEVGPSLNYRLSGRANKNQMVELRLPIRPAFAIDGSGVHYSGWLFQPNLNVDFRNVAGLPDWNLGVMAGPIFGDKRYHQRFYGVDAAYVTSTRPAYQASGGYAGSQLIVALSKHYENHWIGAFVKYDTLNHAVFEDSPLVKSRNNFSAGFAISWRIDKSATLVPGKHEGDDDEQ